MVKVINLRNEYEHAYIDFINRIFYAPHAEDYLEFNEKDIEIIFEDSMINMDIEDAETLKEAVGLMYSQFLFSLKTPRGGFSKVYIAEGTPEEVIRKIVIEATESEGEFFNQSPIGGLLKDLVKNASSETINNLRNIMEKQASTHFDDEPPESVFSSTSVTTKDGDEKEVVVYIIHQPH